MSAPITSVILYHQAPSDCVEGILQHGLRYGAKGIRSKETHAERANAWLDRHLPSQLQKRGVSRRECLYAYLVLRQTLIDVADGKNIVPAIWQPDAGHTKLALRINPSTGFVGDLALYDQLAEVLQCDSYDPLAETLARAYWQSLLPLQEVLDTYQPAGKAGIVSAQPQSGKQAYLERVEVLLTTSVPADRIRVMP